MEMLSEHTVEGWLEGAYRFGIDRPDIDSWKWPL
jgi:phosphoketolase